MKIALTPIVSTKGKTGTGLDDIDVDRALAAVCKHSWKSS